MKFLKKREKTPLCPQTFVLLPEKDKSCPQLSTDKNRDFAGIFCIKNKNAGNKTRVFILAPQRGSIIFLNCLVDFSRLRLYEQGKQAHNEVVFPQESEDYARRKEFGNASDRKDGQDCQENVHRHDAL